MVLFVLTRAERFLFAWRGTEWERLRAGCGKRGRNMCVDASQRCVSVGYMQQQLLLFLVLFQLICCLQTKLHLRGARRNIYDKYCVLDCRRAVEIFAWLLISSTFISCRSDLFVAVVCLRFLGLTARRLISSSSLELQVALIGNMHSSPKKSSCNTWVRINDACPSHPIPWTALLSADLDLNSE